LVSILIVITLQKLKTYTRHGESFPVPVLEGLSISELEDIIAQNNLQYKIIDSLYAEGAAPGTVIEQVPGAGFMVKQNRIIFLTIQPIMSEKVSLPKLTDISFRQALGLIETSGLVVGDITYEPSEYNNLVLKVEQDTTEIFEGEIIQKGAKINLTIGRNSSIQDTPLPDLTGMTYNQAKELISSYMLKTGDVEWEENIILPEDSLAAFVWKQYPGKNIRFVSIGTSIDFWLTLDSLKLPQPEIIQPE
jgi:beta-lactam-binding protein with PASTA domain